MQAELVHAVPRLLMTDCQPADVRHVLY